MKQTKNIERFRLEMIVKAVEDVTTVFDITDALSDYLDLLRDFSGCIENIQNDCNGCLVKENATSEHTPKVLDVCKKVVENLIENLSNIEKAFEELNNKFEVEKDCKNDAYFFILESGNFYKYKQWHFNKKKGDLQSTLEKFWANNMNAPKKKGKK